MEEFCQYNLFKKVNPPLFIPPGYLRASERKGEFKRTPTLQLRASDPSKLLLLCESLQDTCTKDLELKINYYLMEEFECSIAFMTSFLALPNEGITSVIGTSPLENYIPIPSTDSLFVEIIAAKGGFQFSVNAFTPALYDALKKIVPDISGEVFAFALHEQFHKNGVTEYTQNVAYIVFIINTSHQKLFLSQLLQETFRFVLPMLNNVAACERQTKIKNRLQSVMMVAKKLFSNIESETELKTCLNDHAKNIFESERCDMYFLDKAKKMLEGHIMCNGKVETEIVPKNRGVVGYVVSHNKHLNIKKAYDSPLFLKSDDERCNYKTRNILCIPIYAGEVLGAMQLRNKHVGDYNIYDENAAILLGVFGGLALKWTKTLQTLRKESKRQSIANDLLHYEINFREGEIKHLIYGIRPKVEQISLPMFNGRDVPAHRTGLILMKMFEDLDFLETFNIEKKTLATFIVYIMKGYFNHPYHNWEHAFASTQFAYSTIVHLNLIEREILTPLEVLAILVSCICFNVDHRGYANAYRLPQTSSLGSLYTSAGSVMEWHHFSETIVILNTFGCNFLTGLPEDDYKLCLQLIKQNILSTDYARHLKHHRTQEILLERNFRPKSKFHKKLFCSLLMTCSELCDQIRSWKTVRVVAAQCYQEYFKQGDLEKEMGKQPLEIMDRDKACIPELEISFLEEICAPPFKLLVKVLPEMQFCVDAIYANIHRWNLSKRHFLKRDLSEVASLDLLLGKALSITELTKGESGGALDHVDEDTERDGEGEEFYRD